LPPTGAACRSTGGSDIPACRQAGVSWLGRKFICTAKLQKIVRTCLPAGRLQMLISHARQPYCGKPIVMRNIVCHFNFD